jgi:hypothetical protein
MHCTCLLSEHAKQQMHSGKLGFRARISEIESLLNSPFVHARLFSYAEDPCLDGERYTERWWSQVFFPCCARTASHRRWMRWLCVCVCVCVCVIGRTTGAGGAPSCATRGANPSRAAVEEAVSGGGRGVAYAVPYVGAGGMHTPTLFPSCPSSSAGSGAARMAHGRCAHGERSFSLAKHAEMD